MTDTLNTPLVDKEKLQEIAPQYKDILQEGNALYANYQSTRFDTRPQYSDYFKSNTNLKEDLTKKITPPTDINDEKAFKNYAFDITKQRKAKLALALMRRKLENDPKFYNEIQEYYKRIGQQFQLTKEDLDSINSQIATNVLEDTINELGYLPDEIALDKNFINIVDSDTYAYVKGLRDLATYSSDNGFFSSIARGWNADSLRRDLEVGISNKTFTDKEDILYQDAVQNYQNTRFYDGIGQGLGSILHGSFYSPFVNNIPLIMSTTLEGMTIGALAGGGVGSAVTATGGALTGLSVGVLGANAREGYQRYAGQNTLDSLRINKDLELNETLQDVQLSAIVNTLIDTVGFGYTTKVIKGGVSTLVQKLGKRIADNKAQQAINKGVLNAVSDNGKEFVNTFTNKFITASKGALTDYAKLVGTETATEGLTGAISQATVNQITNTDDISIIDSFWDNALEGAKYSAILGAFGALPRGVGSYISISNKVNKIVQAKNAMNTAQNFLQLGALKETIEETSELELNNDLKESLYNKVFENKDLYISATDLKDFFEKHNVSEDLINEIAPNLEEKLQSDPSYAFNISQGTILSKLYNTDTASDLAQILRSSSNAKNLNEAKEIFADSQQVLDTLLQEQEKIVAQNTVLDEISNEIFTSFHNIDIVKPAQARALAEFNTNLYQNLSNITGIDIKTLWESNKITVNKRQETLNLTNKKDDKTIKGETQGLNIIYSKDAKFSTIIHELSHAYLNTIINLSKTTQNEKLGELVSNLEKSFNLQQGELLTLQGDKLRDIHERFASNFLSSFFNENVNYNENARLFKRWIASSFRSLYKNEAHLQKLDDKYNKKNNLKTKSSDTKAKELIDIEYSAGVENEAFNAIEMTEDMNNSFKEFMQALVFSEELRELNDFSNNVEPLFKQGFDTSKLTKEQIQELEKLDELYKEKRYNVEKEYDKLVGISLKNAKLLVSSHNEVLKVFNLLKNNLKKDSSRFKFLNKTQEYYKAYSENLKNKILERQKQDPILSVLKQGIKLNPKYVWSKKQKELLSKYGMLDEKKGASLDDINEIWYNGKASNRTILKDLIEANIKEEDLADWVNYDAVKATYRALQKGSIIEAQTRALGIKELNEIHKKEWSILRKMLGKKSDINTDLTPYAIYELNNTKLGSISSKSLIKTAQTLREKAVQAVAKGDLVSAEQNLKLATLYSTKARLAQSFINDAKKRFDRLNKFYSKPQAQRAKDYDVDLYIIGQAILARLGYFNRAKSNKELKVLAESNNSARKAIYEKYKSLLNDKRLNSDLENLTFNDFNNVVELLTKLKNESSFIRKRNIALDNNTLVGCSVECLQALGDKEPNKSRNVKINGKSYKGTKEKENIKSMLNSFFIKTIGKAENLCKYLDKKENGPFWRYVYKPVRDAADLYKVQKDAVLTNLKSIFDEFEKNNKDIRLNEDGIIKTSEYIGFDLGADKQYRGNPRAQLLGLLLHMGNDYNFRAILKWLFPEEYNADPSGLSKAQAKWNEFFNKMSNLGYIDKNMLDTLQAIWDLNRQVGDLVQEAHKQINGYYYKEQENRPIVTKWGTYKGGYVPLKINKEWDNYNHNLQEAFDNIEKDVMNSQPKVENDFVKDRTGAIGYAVEIDLRVLTYHIDEALRYATLQPSINNVNKLLSSNTLGIYSALNDKLPQIYENFFRPWLQRTALNRNVASSKYPKLAKALREFKSTTGATIMFANFNNTIQGLSNVFTALAGNVNAPYLFSNLGKSIFGYKELEKVALEKSNFMKDRLKTSNDNIQSKVNDLIYRPFSRGTTDKYFYLRKQAINHAYFTQQYVQRRLDVAVWHAKMQQEINNGRTEQEAIALADSAVRETQMSFDVIDSSNIESSNAFVQLFIQFGNYFYTLLNLIYSRWAIANGTNTKLNARVANKAWLLAMGFIVPSIFADAVNKTITGKWWEDDEEGWGIFWDTIVGSPARTALAGIPVFGQGILSVWNSVNGDGAYNSQFFNLPTVSFTTQGIKGASKLITKTFTDDDIKYREWRDASNLLGLAFPPLAPITKELLYLVGLGNGWIDYSSSTDTTRAIVAGGKPTQDNIN